MNKAVCATWSEQRLRLVVGCQQIKILCHYKSPDWVCHYVVGSDAHFKVSSELQLKRAHKGI